MGHDPNIIIVENNYALIENIQLAPNKIETISVNFNFLTKEITSKTKYIYHLVQRDATTNKVIGGETFEINKQARPIFEANAGEDGEIDKNEIITISAGEINESATYNWYDPEGNLIYTGTDLTISPDITKTYKLEIISNIDGFKDYDEVQITVKPHRIESLVPNPVASLLTINYVVEGVASAYITVLNQSTAISNNYILDINVDEVTIDLTSYPLGLYSVILVCDGEIQDSKNLAKQ